MRHFNHKPQFVFLLAAILWGLTNLLITPPFQSPDEPAHFFKAWHIANGNFFPEDNNNHIGGYLPIGIAAIHAPFDFYFHRNNQRININDLIKASSVEIDENTKVLIQFPNTARIFPVPYLPQALGILIGKQFSASPLVWFYIGRLFNLTLWISLVFLAIKQIPLHKWTMVLLALLPMHINIAASLSADVFTNAISFLFIATLLRMAFSEEYLRWKSVIWMLLLLLLVALSKNVYVILALLFFVIPKVKFRKKGFYFAALLLSAGVGIIGFAIGSIYTAKVYNLVEPGVSFFPHFADHIPPVDHHKQLDFILANPIEYSTIFFETILTQWLDMVFSCIGILGWLNIVLPLWYYLFMGFTVIFMALFEGSKNFVITLQNKFVFLLVVVMTVVLIYTISYLTWTPVGQYTIEGLQGRYFIPILPLVFILFYNRWFKFPHQFKAIVTVFVLFISFIVSNVALYEKYWSLF